MNGMIILTLMKATQSSREFAWQSSICRRWSGPLLLTLPFWFTLDGDSAPVAVTMQKMISDSFNSGQGHVVKRVLYCIFGSKDLSIKEPFTPFNTNGNIAQGPRFKYPVITWKDAERQIEEKAGEAK